MPNNLQVYLNFDGRCEEAVEFYKRTVGAEVDVLMRAKDSPDGACAPDAAAGEKIMHTSFRIGGVTVMASDCHEGGEAKFQGFSLALSVLELAECDRVVAATKTFWSPRFAMVTDRFGVSWMVTTCISATE
jgi:PhnB protein